MPDEQTEKPLEEWEKNCPVIFGVQLPPLRIFMIIGLIIIFGAAIFYTQWIWMSGELIPSPSSSVSRPSPTPKPRP